MQQQLKTNPQLLSDAIPELEFPISILGKRWSFSQYDERLANGIAQRFELPEIVARLLAIRGVGFDEVEGFLEPSLKNHLPNPSVLKDMDKAADRIAKAIINQEKVAIFGDYDVDGATSSALLKRFFKMVGLDVIIYIPDRIKEGYGPNSNALLGLKKSGIDLVITVDCGITSFEPLQDAHDAGLEVIVFDHHEAEPRLPMAHAVVNPNRIDEDRSLGHMAAVGVCFMAAIAINRSLRLLGHYKDGMKEPRLTSLLDIVALGTVCDVVPLKTINRLFVSQGLKLMALRRNIGLKALADISGVNEAPTAFHAGFMLGPRVNAGGRVGKASIGSELLSTDDPDLAIELAAQLNTYNSERREIEQVVQEEAMLQMESKEVGLSIVVAGDNWHPGVIGIVASRIKEKYNRPTCIIAFDEQGIGKASARSINGVDLGSVIISAKQKGILIAGGGHKMAAGFSIEKERLQEFEEYLEEKIEQQLAGNEIISELRIDSLLSVNGLNMDLANKLESLAPFGQGNAEPRFVLNNAKIIKPSVIGENHVRCFLQDVAGGKSVKAIAFRALDNELGEALLKAGSKPHYIAGHIKINRWNGQENAEFHIMDVNPAWN